jgi:hypothetical protein
MDELVTIRTFSSSIEFELVKSYLESYEIECYGKDEIINRAYLANANGGVKLQVRKEQVDEAVRLLMSGGYLKQEDFEPSGGIKMMEKLLKFFKGK